MANIRTITLQESEEAETRGQERAKEILDSKPECQKNHIPYLKKEFQRVSRITEMLLENFDPDIFLERDNDKKPEDVLRLMLLGAFESIRCLEGINEELQKIAPDPLYIESIKQYHCKLLQGYYVFATNGLGLEKDEGSIEKFFVKFQGRNKVPQFLFK